MSATQAPPANGHVTTPVEELREVAAAVEAANTAKAVEQAKPILIAQQMDIADAVKEVNVAFEAVKTVVIEQDEYIDMLKRSFFAQQHTFVCGDGGIGKTYGDDKVAEVLGVSHLYTQFRPDMKREEVFGPLAMSGLANDRYEHVMGQGFLQDVVRASLDEFADAGKFTRQLLNALNERWFVNGSTRYLIPLISTTGMANFWPNDPVLAALMDRFAQRLYMTGSLSSEGFKTVLRKSRERRAAKASGTLAKMALPVISREAIGTVLYAVATCNVPAHLDDTIADLRNEAERAQLTGRSPRRWENGEAIACADAVLNGSDTLSETNLRVFRYVLPDAEDEFDAAADLCKGFRDPMDAFMSSIEPVMREIDEMLKPQRARVQRGDKPQSDDYMAITNSVSKIDETRPTLEKEIKSAKKKGRDTTKLEALLDSLDENKTWAITKGAGIGG